MRHKPKRLLKTNSAEYPNKEPEDLTFSETNREVECVSWGDTHVEKTAVQKLKLKLSSMAKKDCQISYGPYISSPY